MAPYMKFMWLILLMFFRVIFCWNSEDFELFDLVEEVNTNFYELLKLDQIVAVSEVLKDEEKRKRYDLILQNGLPDWRQPVYYYRRVRKMSLWELSFFLFTLITLGQYLLAWSIYWEKKYELEEVLISRFRKKEKKSRRNKQGLGEESLIAEHINQLPKPRYQDLLPIRLVSFFFYLIKSAPLFYQQWREIWLDKPKEFQADDSEDDTESKFFSNL
ncbi:dnaJ homolog subfamily C member 1-like [Centruroides sculpturatus]|uniref:dnaJ homolog subfamily C member 1-like n=1 Tax=Centruroides sculpturatus TaxID=218467 RepID=UPI000C6CB81D|nr:dnaJ homolog subfamily C member 1-like [Centruroides sculpturatus]